MINVLDKFYCSSEQVEHKSLLGYLRYYSNKGIDLPINLVEDTQQPTLIFVHTNTVHHVPMQEVQAYLNTVLNMEGPQNPLRFETRMLNLI